MDHKLETNIWNARKGCCVFKIGSLKKSVCKCGGIYRRLVRTLPSCSFKFLHIGQSDVRFILNMQLWLWRYGQSHVPEEIQKILRAEWKLGFSSKRNEVLVADSGGWKMYMALQMLLSALHQWIIIGKKSENKTHCIIPLSFFLRICNFLVHGSKGITIMLKKEKKTIFLFCFWNWMCSSWAFATLLRFYLSYYFRSYHANVTAVKGVAKSSGGLSTGTATCLQTQNKGVACFLLY